jgi:hypothetical protein
MSLGLVMATSLLLGAPPVKLPEVTLAEHVKPHMGEQVAVSGVIERVSLGKGKSEWQGTGLVLDDDTVVFVSYAEPPAGWAELIGARVRVEGLLSPSLTDHEPSLLAPHLRAPTRPVKDERKLSALLNKRVRLVGTARDAKGGAVLLINNAPVYLAGLESWPTVASGKQVAVGGTLVDKQHLPEAKRDAKGAISQGAVGSQLVLEAPTWRLIAEPKP